MRILYLAFADLGVPRAWTTHVFSTCRHLRALGHEVLLVTPSPSREASVGDLPWVRIEVGWGRRKALLRFQDAVRHQVAAWAKSAGAEVVYSRLIPFFPSLAQRAHAIGLPAVVEVNGIVTDELKEEGGGFLRKWIYGWTERRLLERADGVVAVTPSIAQWVRSAYPRVREVEVIENGADPERFPAMEVSSARAQLGLCEARWIGFVGTFFRSRAIETLIQAVGLVRKEIPDARLLLVGDGPARTAAQEAAAPLGAEAVTFLGDVTPERVPIALAAMEVGVFLATLPRAQSPLKVFEYMASRRPVVASSTAGIGAWVEGMGAGVSVDPTSTESVASGIVRLLRDAARARMMGEKGREAVEGRYNWRRSATELAAFLARVVSEWKTHDAR